MKEKVYIETSVVSFLTARPSQNLIAAAWQSVTIDWWENRRRHFNLFISELVFEEIKRGDITAAQIRKSAIEGLPYLQITDEVAFLAKLIVQPGPLPLKAAGDALHLAVAAVHNIDYLLTWNCRHLDNAEFKPKVRKLLQSHGYHMPEICTPQELLGENRNGK